MLSSLFIVRTLGFVKLDTKTPAEAFSEWIRVPGARQALLRWLALIPGVAIIFLFSQITLLFVLSLINQNGNEKIVLWLMNMLNVAFVPFLIIKYGTPIAPSFRRHTSVALAVVAVCIVALSRLAFELSHPSPKNWRYTWLAIAVIVCGASVWRGIRDVSRKESSRDKSGPLQNAVW